MQVLFLFENFEYLLVVQLLVLPKPVHRQNFQCQILVYEVENGSHDLHFIDQPTVIRERVKTGFDHLLFYVLAFVDVYLIFQHILF